MLRTRPETSESQQPVAHSASARPRGGIRLALGALVLAGVVAALIAGCEVTPRQSTTSFHHTPNAPNTGQSLLYLSKHTSEMTMLRTSDGATLWQYTLPGFLSTGLAANLGVAFDRGGAINIVNGVVYFVLNPSLPDTPGLDPWDPNRQQTLTALRAADGIVLWQQPVKSPVVELLGVSDGVVCINTIQRDTASKFSSALYGYSASAGTRVWQRDSAAITADDKGFPILRDGVLYAYSADSGGSTTLDNHMKALQASTGQTLWQIPASAYGTAQFHSGPELPVAAENGVAVFYAESSGGATLTGVDEGTGKVLWSYQLPLPILTLPRGGSKYWGVFERNGALSFVTSDAAGGIPKLYHLDMATGKVLWQQSLSSYKGELYDMAVSDDRVYILSDSGGRYVGLTLAANDVQTGLPRWQYQPIVPDFGQLAVAGGVVLLQVGSTLVGLQAGDGSLLWQHSLKLPLLQLTAVGDFFVLASFGSNLEAVTICGVQSATGEQWCRQFVTGLGTILAGP